MVILKTKDGELRVEKGARIRINAIGDVSVDGYARKDDEPVNERDAGTLTTLCIAKGEHVLYAYVEGHVEAVKEKVRAKPSS